MSDYSNKAVLNNLRRVETRIKKGWCKGDYAKDANGKVVNSNDKTATCWCLSGALRATSNPAFDDTEYFASRSAILAAGTNVGAKGIPTWNDEYATSKEEVLAVIRKAINLVRRSIPKAPASVDAAGV